MSVFTKIKVHLPKRTKFRLSQKASLDCDIGQMPPFFVRETYPGDVWKLYPEAVVNFAPLVAPITTPIKAYFEFWFCSYRNLFELKDDGANWEDFISGGKQGDDEQIMPLDIDPNEVTAGKVNYGFRSIEDYLGIAPAGVDIHKDDVPHDMPRRAVNWIYNSFYRDQDLQEERELTDRSVPVHNWRRDYFMSARPFRQRGQSPAFPMYGFAPLQSYDKSVKTFGVSDYMKTVSSSYSQNATFFLHNQNSEIPNDYHYASNDDLNIADKGVALRFSANSQNQNPNAASTSAVSYYRGLNNPSSETSVMNGVLGIHGNDLVSFDMAEFRRARDVQRFMELNARAGVRYVEFLTAHYGIAPSDSTLQRPQFLGGTTEDIIVSQVLQTSESNTTPQGTLAGKGMMVHTARKPIKFLTREIGLILGFFYTLPSTQYQQGIPREWSRRSRWDFMFPEFQHLSEQAVKQKEIFVGDNTTENNKTFGYQGMYQELRCSHSHVAGAMRSNYPQSLDYWHMAFDFSQAPLLNGSLLACNPPKRIFAVPSEPGLLCELGVDVTCIRPLARYAIPY